MNITQRYQQYVDLLLANQLEQISLQEAQYLLSQDKPEFTQGAKKKVLKTVNPNILYTEFSPKELLFSLEVGIGWLKNKRVYKFSCPIIHYIQQVEDHYEVLMERVKFDFQLKSIYELIFVEMYEPVEHKFMRGKSILDENVVDTISRMDLIISYIESVNDFNFMLKQNNILCSEYETLVRVNEGGFHFIAIDFEHCFDITQKENYKDDVQEVLKHVGMNNIAIRKHLYQTLSIARKDYLKGQINPDKYILIRCKFILDNQDLLLSEDAIFEFGSDEAPKTKFQKMPSPKMVEAEGSPRTPEQDEIRLGPMTPQRPRARQVITSPISPRTPEQDEIRLNPMTPARPRARQVISSPVSPRTPEQDEIRLNPMTPKGKKVVKQPMTSKKVRFEETRKRKFEDESDEEEPPSKYQRTLF